MFLGLMFVLWYAGTPLSNIKSPDNCHVWMIYIGGETGEELRNELKATAQSLHVLMKEGITCNGETYIFEPVLTCDLAALVVLLGLYEVYRSNAVWRCPWCAVCNDKLGDFSIPTWPLHNDAHHRVEEEKVSRLKGKSKFAAKHYGIIAPRVLDINLDHVIPCNMHAIMAITRHLFQLLVHDVEDSPTLVCKFEKVHAIITLDTMSAQN
jgi:hypothetical protein